MTSTGRIHIIVIFIIFAINLFIVISKIMVIKRRARVWRAGGGRRVKSVNISQLILVSDTDPSLVDIRESQFFIQIS